MVLKTSNPNAHVDMLKGSIYSVLIGVLTMYSMVVPQELETEPSDELAVPYLWEKPKDSYLTLDISSHPYSRLF